MIPVGISFFQMMNDKSDMLIVFMLAIMIVIQVPFHAALVLWSPVLIFLHFLQKTKEKR